MATTPLFLASRHDLEDIFTAMRPCFEDKESEDNFKLRDQAITKLRRLTVGNAPNELSDTYAIGIKTLIDGIIKVVNSLRTTVSKNGCDLIQEMAKAQISNMDHIAEIVLPHLVKLCASTKKIAAEKANETTTIVISNVSYNIYLMKLIWSACDDKNVQPRKYATGWLKTLVGKHRDNKHVFEKGDGLPLFEKCLKKGLADTNPDVRQAMRPTYWAFIRLWPERSAGILSTLSDQHRKVLRSETSDAATAPPPPRVASAAAVKSAASKPKQSIKDTIAAKRQAAKVEKAPAPEPKIATSSASTKSDKIAVAPNKVSTSAPSDPRPASVATATRTLSSAPVRPARLMRKPTTTAKMQTPDFSKSAIEVPKAASPKPAAKVKRPCSAGSIEATKLPESAPQVSPPLSSTTSAPGLSHHRKMASPPLTLLGERSKSSESAPQVSQRISPTTSAPGLSPHRKMASPPLKSPESDPQVSRSLSPTTSAPGLSPHRKMAPPPLTLLRERSNSSESALQYSRPLSPTTSAPGLSPHRELATPPIITMLRQRSLSPASSDKPTSKTSETLSATSFDRPTKPICSRKEGLARKALEELDINEAISKPSRGEAVSQEKWMKVERHQLTLSSPQEEMHLRPANLDYLRRKMFMRISDIKVGTYRLSTFREIQCMIRGSWPVLGDDAELFDELLFALFNLIESWSCAELGTVRDCGSDHNTQVLLTLRVMLRYHNNLFSTYYPRALTALLSAARKQDDSTHMRFGLEDTVKAVIQECDVGNLEDSIDSILDFLESYTEPKHRQPEHLGLLALTELMNLSDPERLCRPVDQARRLGRLAARSMRSTYPELRQRAVEFAMTYASFLADDKEFWKLTSDISNDRARLLTYYFTKERVLQAFRVEEELIKHRLSA
ncbi:MAG: hypothetical protein Q9178_004219 [Gyalolechia marmorata]